MDTYEKILLIKLAESVVSMNTQEAQKNVIDVAKTVAEVKKILAPEKASYQVHPSMPSVDVGLSSIPKNPAPMPEVDLPKADVPRSGIARPTPHVPTPEKIDDSEEVIAALKNEIAKGSIKYASLKAGCIDVYSALTALRNNLKNFEDFEPVDASLFDILEVFYGKIEET